MSISGIMLKEILFLFESDVKLSVINKIACILAAFGLGCFCCRGLRLFIKDFDL